MMSGKLTGPRGAATADEMVAFKRAAFVSRKIVGFWK
jgi:hypothetical protein